MHTACSIVWYSLSLHVVPLCAPMGLWWAVQMWDYGVEGNSFVVVLRRYDASLAQWRSGQPEEAGPLLPLYLTIFAQILRAVQVPPSFLPSLPVAPAGAPSLRTTSHISACSMRGKWMRVGMQRRKWVVMQALHAVNTVHFDLKCDNVLLEALPGAPPHTWSTHLAAMSLPFRIVLADFGESCAFGDLR